MTGEPGQRLPALWLSALQRLTDRTAHDIRNALNGVAVNLEVTRARAARGAEVTAIAPFATAAAGQLEILTGQLDALLTVLRPAGETTDVGSLLGRLVALARGSGKGSIDLEDPPSGVSAVTAANATAVRLTLASALLEALARDDRVTCRLGTEEAPTVYIDCYAGGPLRLAGDIVAAVTEMGISLAPAAHGITITFPFSPRE